MTVSTVAGFVWAASRVSPGQGGYSLGGPIAKGLWDLNNVIAMSIMVRAAFWKSAAEEGAA